MPELISFTALRSPDELSPKEIDKFGIHTHPKNLKSERFRDWESLCLRKEYKALKDEMKHFLVGDMAITKLSQMPPGIASVIEFVEYHGFSGFDMNTFSGLLDKEVLANEFGKKNKKRGCHDENAPFFRLVTNLSDQLLASTQIDVKVKRDFDLPVAIRTSNLLRTTYLVGQEKIRLKIKKHFEKPLIINSCIITIDPCSHPTTPPGTKPVIFDNGESERKRECRCKEHGHDDCECKCNDKCVEQNPCCATIKPYIAELFVVRDEVCKYQPGDMSYIKNIIKGETQERIHRDLVKETSFSESVEEIKEYEEKFLEVTDKSNVKKTIEDIIKDETKVHAGVYYGKGTKEKPGGLFVEGTFDFKRNRDRTNKIIQDKTKDIIEKLTSRLERNTKVTKQHTLHKETEITNTSKLTGIEADVSRQLFYVNQIRTAQVYSHGIRTMLDFYVPGPAELLKTLVKKQFNQKKPEKPCTNIEEIGITKADWLEYVQCHGLTDLEFLNTKPEIIRIPISGSTPRMEDKGDRERDPILSTASFDVPDGYVATQLKIDGYESTHRDEEFWSKVIISNGNSDVFIEHTEKDSSGNSVNWWTANNRSLSDTMNNLEGQNILNITNYHTTTYNIMIHIICEIKPEKILNWQLEVHKSMMEKYKSDLETYERALAKFEKEKENYFNKNPFILNEMMQMQLKHAAISYITCQFFDDNDALKGKVKDCGFPQMDLPQTKIEGAFVRFCEQAFEWHFMNYMLYPYFWERKCTWEDKLKEDADNYLFTRFLQSGFARITISVTPGFEEIVNCYLQTKQLWCGQEAPVLGVGFVPIHKEIKESKDNYNADRDGYLKWNTNLSKDEILLYDNLDYYSEDLDPISGTSLGTYSFDAEKAKIDLNREVNINCVTYRIVAIDEDDSTNDVVKFSLDRVMEIDCCCNGSGKDFDDIYNNRELPWSTGAIFIGAPWKYTLPTSLVWLREDGGCLPCYPIEC